MGPPPAAIRPRINATLVPQQNIPAGSPSKKLHCPFRSKIQYSRIQQGPVTSQNGAGEGNRTLA